MSMMDTALEYATRYGWAVFPLARGTKSPLTPHGFKDAKKDPGAIRAWWTRYPDANIGIATGTRSNLIVIDEDLDYDKGKEGYKAVCEWERENGEMPETVRAITGRGGAHVYYRYTGSDFGNREDIIYGVDIRGEGGYVVAPPSIHKNGSAYQWEIAPDEIEIAEVNETVLAFLMIGKTQNSKTGKIENANSERFQLPATIQEGARNGTLYRLACSLQAQGVPDDGILLAVESANNERCAEPLEQEEVEKLVKSALSHKKGELKVINSGLPERREPELICKVTKDGEITDQPLQTIANCEEAILYDDALYGRIRYNEIAYAPYVYGSLPWRQWRGWREWNNTDDSNLRSYIEDKYGMKSMEKIMDALTNVCSRYPVNPIKDMLEQCHEEWDGNKHVENLLPTMLGAEKSEYTTEVMRLFMLGAVARIFHPGCKFDYMIVLVSGQGTGKSTFLRMLALNDAWFHDNFNTLDGDKAFEKLRGMWIVELAELQALKRAKDSEITKAFITSRVDTYRTPYGRRTEQHPRMCVLAGTSNPVDFLTDRTGNRRFLPVTCGVNPVTFDMFADERATKAEMVQAWGEIMDEFKRCGGKPKLTLPKRLQTKAIEMQTAYLEEDPDVGIIQKWLDQTDQNRVCVAMLWKEALKHEYEILSRKDTNRLHEMMKNVFADKWKYVNKQSCGLYGIQRCYERKDDFIAVNPDEIPFD